MRLIISLISLLITGITAVAQTAVGNSVYIDQIGNSNTISVIQEGTGNHTASIQGLQGNNNNISLSQSGSGNHELNILNTPNTTNSNNNITTIQSGNTGSDKHFNIWLNGTNGATVNVIQSNPATADQGSMTIQCFTNCGTWTYTKQ